MNFINKININEDTIVVCGYNYHCVISMLISCKLICSFSLRWMYQLSVVTLLCQQYSWRRG